VRVGSATINSRVEFHFGKDTSILLVGSQDTPVQLITGRLLRGREKKPVIFNRFASMLE